MDYKSFYARLFAPLEASIGPIDPLTICAIIGFDGGGPLSFSTIGANNGESCITYISCELAVRDEQRPTDIGRYELLCECNDEQWVRLILSKLGQMSLWTTFGHGHTVDIGEIVGADKSIQVVVLQIECSVTIDNEVFAIYRVIGITRPELEYKESCDTAALIELLRDNNSRFQTLVNRESYI